MNTPIPSQLCPGADCLLLACTARLLLIQLTIIVKTQHEDTSKLAIVHPLPEPVVRVAAALALLALAALREGLALVHFCYLRRVRASAPVTHV